MNQDELLTRAVSDVVPRALAEEKLKSGKKLRIYLGIDPTGAKLHLGHSVPLRKLKAFADAGHHVIFLIGSFTAMIGDPSGQDKMREPLTKEQVEKNFESYKKQASKILDFSKIELRYNHEWLEKLGFEDIVKIASNFTVQQMEEREMFERRRMQKVICANCDRRIILALPLPDNFREQAKKGSIHLQISNQDIPISNSITCDYCGHLNMLETAKIVDNEPIGVHEFLYPLMVGYDSVVLDVDVELGGNDQLFNMLAGRTLQKAYGKRDKFVLTTRLIEGTDGRKMSKTYDNCIWLEDSAKDMYGKLMSINDELIIPYFEACTDVPVQEYKELEKSLKKGMNPKDAKMQLARAVVTLYLGKDAAAHAEAEFQNVFADHKLPEDIKEVKAGEGTLLIDLMVKEKLASSKTDAKRLIEQGGVHLNDKTVTSIEAKVEKGVLKVGKRKFVRIIL